MLAISVSSPSVTEWGKAKKSRKNSVKPLIEINLNEYLPGIPRILNSGAKTRRGADRDQKSFAYPYFCFLP